VQAERVYVWVVSHRTPLWTTASVLLNCASWRGFGKILPAEGAPNDWKSRSGHVDRGKYLSPANSGTPAASTVTVPTELLCSLHFSLILSYLRLSVGASDFLFSGAPRAPCSLGAGIFHTRGLNDRSLKLNVRCQVKTECCHMTSWRAQGHYLGKEITAETCSLWHVTPCWSNRLTLQDGSRFLQPVLRQSDRSSSSMVLSVIKDRVTAGIL